MRTSQVRLNLRRSAVLTCSVADRFVAVAECQAGEAVDLEQLRAEFELVDLRPAAFGIVGKFLLEFRQSRPVTHLLLVEFRFPGMRGLDLALRRAAPVAGFVASGTVAVFDVIV